MHDAYYVQTRPRRPEMSERILGDIDGVNGEIDLAETCNFVGRGAEVVHGKGNPGRRFRKQ